MRRTARAALPPDWLEPLLQVYRGALGRADDADEGATSLAALHDAVLLARTAARRLTLDVAAEPGPQVVVLGPTQAGKSTLVNLLLGTESAGVNALAGHTVHAQAFVPVAPGDAAAADDVAERVAARLEPLLAPLRRLPLASLERDVRDAWSCEAVASKSAFAALAAATSPTSVWDTPDFDSIEAGSYRDAVTLASGVADVLLVVLSKDKYGDLAVWRRLALLRALGTPLVLIVNKLDADDEATVAAALAARWRERGEHDGHAGQPVATVLLPWTPQGDGLAVSAGRRRALEEALGAGLDRARDRAARRASLARFIDARQDDWLAPLRAEHAARDDWRGAVDAAAAELVAGYRQRYLDGGERYEAFDRTLVELLALLEVPGIARALARTRQAVTWPARRLFGLGAGAAADVVARLGAGDGRLGTALRGAHADVADPAAAAFAAGAREREVLDTLLDAALVSLRDRAFTGREDEADAAVFWRGVEYALVHERDRLHERWSRRCIALRERFQPRIEAAAHGLYERLQQQPALLNTLRTVRVGTDAAGVALALKSGGVAPADLVLAPAMLSITTLLTESALGRYLDTVKRDLKREQQGLMDAELVQGLFVPALHALGDGRTDGTLLPPESDPSLLRLLREPTA